MGDTAIGWTDVVWNPLAGCTRVSAGCQHCYAERLAHRLAAMGQAKYRGLTKKVGDEVRWTGRMRFDEDALDLPLRWKKPRRIFVNSMSDLFHEQVEDAWIDRIFAVMAQCPQHVFQVLTKRAGRMRDYTTSIAALAPKDRSRRVIGSMYRDHPVRVRPELIHDDFIGGFPWPLDNVHLGVSVEDQATADERIPLLLETPAAVRWVSYEPALGPVKFSADWRDWLAGWDTHPAHECHGDEDRCRRSCPVPEQVQTERLDWIVVGGESGPDRRDWSIDWLRSTIAQCRAAGVPIYVKQDSANRPGQQGRIPDDLWIHEFPTKEA